MRGLYLRIRSIFALGTGMLLVLLGVVGLFLPIIPGLVLILVGVWIISKVYDNPLLARILEFVRRKKDGIIKEHPERRTIEL